MAAKKIITVFGATGAQGGGIISTFLSDAKLNTSWALRGVTRDVTKDSSKKLAEQGVEVVSADLNDKASLVKAMTGSYAVYAVTNYWEKADAAVEIAQGKNIADAAKETGVQHLIWSSLYNVTEHSKGKLSQVFHFDSKAKIEEYIREIGVPATFFMPGFYMANISGGMMRQMPPDNVWTFALPIKSSAPIPVYDPKDTGKYIKAIVLNREKLLGERFLGATTYMSGQEVVDVFKKVFPEAGATARYFETPKEMFKNALMGMGSPEYVAQELYENMRLMEDFGYYFGEPLEPSHAFLEDPLTTWEEHVKAVAAWSELK